MDTKESIYELQKLDCNCNDCKFLVRSMERFQESLELHHKWQLDYFTVIRSKLYEKAEWYRSRGEDGKANTLKNEADKMKFQFNRIECRLNFGDCTKFNKPVTFLPGVLQLDTQECFEHRKTFLK